MKLDTSKDGRDAVFRKYQQEIIDILIEDGEHGSGYMHSKLTKRSVKISRASVIFFMNDLVDEGLATFREQSGKGGFGRIYKIPMKREEFNSKVALIFLQKLSDAIGFTGFKELVGEI